MRRFAAIDEAPGGPERGQSQRVGGGPGGDRKDPHRGLEQFGKALLQRRRPFVGAIAERGAVIGADQRVEDFGRGAAGVVAAIVDHRLLSFLCMTGRGWAACSATRWRSRGAAA